MTRLLHDINVSPDFTGLPPSVYHGLVHLTNNAAAVLTLVAGLGVVVSLIGLVIASFTANVPSSTAGVSAKEPRNLPIGVRAPSMMTAVSMGGVYRPPFGRPPGVRPRSRIASRIRASAAPPSTGSDGGTSHRSTRVG